MRIGRTIPPSAAPLSWRNLWNGVTGGLSHRAIAQREQEFRQAFGVDHVFLVSSGTAALALSLLALRSLSSRSEVVIPAYTCFSVPAAVLKAGLRPVLCDIDSTTFDYDHALLQRAIGPATLCVVTHHLFGVPSDVERTRALCRPGRVFVIEDAAQAMGVESNRRKLGTLGDVGIFSFGRGKHITCGGGGAIVTGSNEIANAIAEHWRRLPSSPALRASVDLLQLALMTIFIHPRLYWLPAAVPFLRLGETIFPDEVRMERMSGMKAGLLRGWEGRLVDANRRRSATAAYFVEHLPVRVVHEHPYLRLPVVMPTAEAKRKVCSASKARGLGLSAAYPAPVSDIPQIRSVCGGGPFPSARRVARNLVTVPTHAWLSDSDKRAIANLWQEARIA